MQAFQGCSGLTSVTFAPNSQLTSIGIQAFQNCSNLTSAVIGNGVTSIGECAFKNCNSLATVNYNATNCTTMGTSSDPVFQNCSSFSTLNIGENVTVIPNNAFKNCTSFSSIVSEANNPPAIYATSFDSGLSPMTPVIVPCGTVDDYETHWPYFRNIQQSPDCGSTDVSDDYTTELAIFPNPANDILNITSPETISEIEIMNSLGQAVYRAEVNADNAVCNVEDLTSGVYVLRIRTLGEVEGSAIMQMKFVKK